jgi:MFS family permease
MDTKQISPNSSPILSKIYRICLNANIGSFMYGYGVVVFASTMTTVSSTLGWGSQETLLIAIMSALFPFGAFIGALISGSMITKYGVWKSMCISDVIGIIGALITIIPFTPTFAVGRFISGVATGLFTCLIPGYVFEISPIAVSGKTGSMFNILLACGILLASLFGLALPIDDEDGGMEYWWMFMFGFQGLVYAYQLFNFIVFFKYDSKTQLLSENRNLDSSSLMGNQHETEITELKDMTAPPSGKPQEVTYSDIFKSKFRKMLRLSVIMAICFQFSGINGIVGYSITLYLELGSSLMLSRILSAVLGMVEVLGAFGVLPFIDKYGRKTLYITGCIVMMMSLALAGILSFAITNGGIAILILIYVYVFTFQISMGSITFLYFGEVVNGKIMSVAVGITWIAYMIVAFVFPFEIAILGVEGTLFIFAGILAACGVYTYFDMVDTKGLNKQQIEKLFF